MLMTITDEVEIGHTIYIGGSTKISLKTEEDCYSLEEQQLLDVIDTLDHSMIAFADDASKFYKRYYVIDRTAGFYADVAAIIFERLKRTLWAEPKDFQVEVELGKVKYLFNYHDVETRVFIEEMF